LRCLELSICANVRRDSRNIITRTRAKQPEHIVPPLGFDIIDPRDDLLVDRLVIVDIMSLALDDLNPTGRSSSVQCSTSCDVMDIGYHEVTCSY
jgi:hypothetical protein